MKRQRLFCLLIASLFSLQGCISFGDRDEDSSNKVERTTIGSEEFNEEENIKAYYPTIEKAIKNNTFLDGKPLDLILVQTLKVIQDKDSCIFYGTVFQKDDQEFFTAMRFRLQEKAGKVEYSNPMAYTPLIADFIDGHVHKNSSIMKEQEMSLNLYNDHSSIKRVASYPNFIWSLTAKKDVFKLKVNNQKPTEIIPFELENKKLYFYYFNDLKNQDEFVVTT